MCAEAAAQCRLMPGPGQGEPARSRSRYRRRWLLGAGALPVAAALVLAMMLGAAYQPVTYGIDVAAVQGQVRIRAVNTFDGMTGQTYARLLGIPVGRLSAASR